MREIKFRGQYCPGIRNAGKWVYWDYRGCDVIDCIDSDTIGQYTGLKDKNGLGIYEGDVVRIKPTRQADGVGEVIFSERGAKFAVRKKKRNGYMANETYLYSLIGCEVLGNIYENPELLDG